MKIAMIGHKRVPSREGGIEVVVTELSVRMAARGYQVECFNRWEPSVQEKMPRRDEYAGVQLLRVRTFRRSSLNAIVYAIKAVWRAVFKGYDVIHIHAIGPAVMTWLPHLLRIPTVVTVHGLDWQRAKWGAFATRFLRAGEKMAARYADELIVLTQSAAQYFQTTYGRNCCVVPNGITPPKSAPPKDFVQKWGLKPRYVLFLARIVPEKGLHYLIEAFRGLETDCQLVIAGALDGSEYVNSVREQAVGDDRILFIGFVNVTTLNGLMDNAGVYVLPSDVEGLALSLLEALSCGTRCLVSDIAENREAAGEYAEYFRHGDVQDLREKLSQMLETPEAPDLAERRRAFARSRYDWERVTDATLDVYRQAILGKGKKHG